MHCSYLPVYRPPCAWRKCITPRILVLRSTAIISPSLLELIPSTGIHLSPDGNTLGSGVKLSPAICWNPKSANPSLWTTITGNTVKLTVANGNLSLIPPEHISPFLPFVLYTDFASLWAVIFAVANHDNATIMLLVTNTDPSETVG